MALDTVSDYIVDVRVLLQDTIAPYRYDDASLLTAFNVAIMEARRIRPDLFVYDPRALPQFTAVDTTEVVIEAPFRPAFVYAICSHAIARDQEDVQDARASSFMKIFDDILLGVRRSQIIGGATPGGGGKQQ